MPATLADMYIKNFVDATDESGLTYRPVGDIFSPTGYEVTGYTGSGTALTIPDTYNGKDVTAVLDGVFQGNTTLTAITLGTKLQTPSPVRAATTTATCAQTMCCCIM